MARQLRVEFENILYHITSRRNQRDKIFYVAADKGKFLEIMSRTKVRYGDHQGELILDYPEHQCGLHHLRFLLSISNSKYSCNP